MKKINLLVTLFCLAALFACHTPNTIPDNQFSEIEIGFLDEQIDSSALQNLGLYVIETSDDLIDNPVIDNEKVESADNHFKLSFMDRVDIDANYNVYAYSPHKAQSLVDGRYLKFELGTDQQQLSDVVKNNFLYSKTTAISLKSSPIKIMFSHLMSQVDLIVTFVDEVKPAAFAAELHDFCSTADIDMMTGNLENVGGKSDIKPYVNEVVFDKAVMSGIKAIVVPQKKLSGQRLCRITADGVQKDVVLDRDVEFVRGKKTIISIQMGREISINVTIVDWNDALVGGEVQNPVPELYDIEGNRYGVVAIGDLYWTDANLRTTKFNDGTKIKEGRSDAEWLVADYGNGESRYCHYNNDPADVKTRGLLYNWLVVKSGKICPRGWSIPSREQWLAMRELLGGEEFAGNELKTTSGWADKDGLSIGRYQGTNSVGFNAIPSGYRGHLGRFDHYPSGIGINSFVGWWSSSRDSGGIKGYCFQILYIAGNLVEETLLLDYGFSLRCVRSIK